VYWNERTLCFVVVYSALYDDSIRVVSINSDGPLHQRWRRGVPAHCRLVREP
jgi:hypothetical protein